MIDLAPQRDPVALAAGDAGIARRGAQRCGRRRSVSGRRRALSVHRDSRGRGGDPECGRARDHPAWRLGLSRRDEPAVGQTVFLTAVVTQPMRYIAVDRDELRPLLFEDGPLGDLLLSTFMARREALQQQGVGMEVFGPRSSEPTRRIVEFAPRNRLPYVWRDPEHTRRSGGRGADRGARSWRGPARAVARRARAA